MVLPMEPQWMKVPGNGAQVPRVGKGGDLDEQDHVEPEH
jgi:hypothetical protein